MLKETLIQIYENDLNKVIKEIKLYNKEEDIWKLEEGITNSGGNLALHIIGNINHYFGANLGATGYKRERDLEFSDKNVSRTDLINRLEETINIIRDTLDKMSDEDWHKDYPENLGDENPKTISVVIYMLSHLNYHLGQINYHRRLTSK